jgi:hypothetical protein
VTILNDPGKVTVARALTPAPDGRPAHAVHERGGEKRLLGYVARSRVTPGGWAYREADGGYWTMAGWSQAEAVDHLQSRWAPQAPFLLPE